MNNPEKCEICQKPALTLNSGIYHCAECQIIYVRKNYDYRADYFTDFSDAGFVKQKEQIFKDFLNDGEIAGLKNNGLKVLDVGCATGDFIKYCQARTNWRLTGLDVSAEALAIAKEKNPSADFFLGELAELAVKSEAAGYDLVFSSHTLEHVKKPRDFIQAVKSVLKEGGRAYLEIPNERTYVMLYNQYNKFYDRKIKNQRYLNHPYGHVFYYNNKSLRRLMSGQFSSVRIKYAQFSPITAVKDWPSRVKKYLKNVVFRVFPFFHVSDRIIIIAK